MAGGPLRFDRFVLDAADRQLLRDGVPVELNARYFDALALLVSEGGRLVSKDRFLDEVWRGVPVTDEALTQCIKTLRRVLGDDAARPRFIETVPKHGYRFIAAVGGADRTRRAPPPRAWLWLGAAGTVGGGVAGFGGGMLYGFAGASGAAQPGVGAASVLLVLLCLCILVGLIGGAGVGFGIAAVRAPGAWRILGGAGGGLVVGAVVKLLGLDAFNLLLGRAPDGITGGLEGALLGAAAGLGSLVASRRSLRVGAAAAGAAGALAGAGGTLLGGRLMAGSLAQLAGIFPEASLRFDRLGGMFGESGFGPISGLATAALEGAIFCACVVVALTLAARQLTPAK